MTVWQTETKIRVFADDGRRLGTLWCFQDQRGEGEWYAEIKIQKDSPGFYKRRGLGTFSSEGRARGALVRELAKEGERVP